MEVHVSAGLRGGAARGVSSDSIPGEALVAGSPGVILARDPQHAALGARARATKFRAHAAAR
jgi:hypothetical protein